MKRVLYILTIALLAVACMDIKTSDPYQDGLNVLTVAAQWPEGDFSHEGASVLVWVGIAFFCGVLWELLQLCNVVSGTGDFWDILMYSIAALLATIIKSNKKGE